MNKESAGGFLIYKNEVYKLKKPLNTGFPDLKALYHRY